MFSSKAGAYPLACPTLKHWTRLEIFTNNDKQSSLFCCIVSDEEGTKSVKILSPGVNVIKLFPFITVDEAK
jgi:hypothetical protein